MPVKEKFTPEDLAEAMTDLATLKYFPRESTAAIMALLVRMVPHKRALRWLVRECVDHVGEWPGPAEFRGILCTRFDAADGIDQACNLPGYRPDDAEMRYLERHEAVKSLPPPNIAKMLGLPAATVQPKPISKPALHEHKPSTLTDWEREQLQREAGAQ